jgi:hypothetical protein
VVWFEAIQDNAFLHSNFPPVHKFLHPQYTQMQTVKQERQTQHKVQDKHLWDVIFQAESKKKSALEPQRCFGFGKDWKLTWPHSVFKKRHGEGRTLRWKQIEPSGFYPFLPIFLPSLVPRLFGLRAMKSEWPPAPCLAAYRRPCFRPSSAAAESSKVRRCGEQQWKWMEVKWSE